MKKHLLLLTLGLIYAGEPNSPSGLTSQGSESTFLSYKTEAEKEEAKAKYKHFGFPYTERGTLDAGALLEKIQETIDKDQYLKGKLATFEKQDEELNKEYEELQKEKAKVDKIANMEGFDHRPMEKKYLKNEAEFEEKRKAWTNLRRHINKSVLRTWIHDYSAPEIFEECREIRSIEKLTPELKEKAVKRVNERNTLKYEVALIDELNRTMEFDSPWHIFEGNFDKWQELRDILEPLDEDDEVIKKAMEENGYTMDDKDKSYAADNSWNAIQVEEKFEITLGMSVAELRREYSSACIQSRGISDIWFTDEMENGKFVAESRTSTRKGETKLHVWYDLRSPHDRVTGYGGTGKSDRTIQPKYSDNKGLAIKEIEEMETTRIVPYTYGPIVSSAISLYTNLVELYISGNTKEIPGALGFLKNLRVLKIEEQKRGSDEIKVETIHPNAFDLPNLECLHIIYCEELRSLPDLSNLKNLRCFFSYQNRFREFPKSIFNCTKLEELRFEHFHYINADMSDLNKLNNLVRFCIYSGETFGRQSWKLPNEINLEKLEIINLNADSSSKYEGKPKFGNCPKLRRLEISKWPLRGDENLIGGCPLLQRLIAKLEGRKLPEGLRNCKNLVDVRFNINDTEVPEWIEEVVNDNPNLTNLYINVNGDDSERMQAIYDILEERDDKVMRENAIKSRKYR